MAHKGHNNTIQFFFRDRNDICDSIGGRTIYPSTSDPITPAIRVVIRNFLHIA